jgi:hypothetical protein
VTATSRAQASRHGFGTIDVSYSLDASVKIELNPEPKTPTKTPDLDPKLAAALIAAALAAATQGQEGPLSPVPGL